MDPESKNKNILQNIGNHSPIDMTSYPKGLESSCIIIVCICCVLSAAEIVHSWLCLFSFLNFKNWKLHNVCCKHNLLLTTSI